MALDPGQVGGVEEQLAQRREVGMEVRAVNGDGPRCGCGKASALHLRPLGEKRGRFFCTRCVVDALSVVEAPVSPPEDDQGEGVLSRVALLERIGELEAALRELLAMWDSDDWDAKVERETWERARRVLRGSVPAGEEHENG